MWAVMGSDEGLSVLKVLLQARGDLDLDVRSSIGNTAVMWAVFYNSPRCLRLLLERGASMEGKYSDGQTVKEMARRCWNTEVLAVLEQEERRRGELYRMAEDGVTG